MTDEARTEIQSALDAGTALAKTEALSRGALCGVLIPEGAEHRVVDLERYDNAPRRASGTYRPATVGSLIAVVDRYETAATTLWVHPTNGHVIAIFNDSDGEDPGWRDHRAELSLQVTDEWKHWKKLDGQLVTQLTFAEHIEDGLPEISEPPGADMLELAQSFHATQNANFRSAHRLQDGTVQTQYDETVDASAGKSGQMQIPTEFKLALSPFLGEPKYKVTARLRFRLTSGKLSLGYTLERPDDVVRAVLDDVAERLRKHHPDKVFIGEPGS